VLEHTDAVDLARKPAVWDGSYSFQRPHAGLAGRTPYEVLRGESVS